MREQEKRRKPRKPREGRKGRKPRKPREGRKGRDGNRAKQLKRSIGVGTLHHFRAVWLGGKLCFDHKVPADFHSSVLFDDPFWWIGEWSGRPERLNCGLIQIDQA